MQNKVCSTCNIRQPLDAFHSHPHGRGGKSHACKTCSVDKTRQWREMQAFRRREGRYWISNETYLAMLEEQGGGCAICGKSESGRYDRKQLFVDHDHTSGRVRGLLCHQCNAAIGLLQDSEEILEKAIGYLRRSRS